MFVRVLFGLSCLALSACGSDAADSKKQQPIADAAPDGAVPGAGGFVVGMGGQSASGGSQVQSGSGGSFGTGGSSVQTSSGGSLGTGGNVASGTGGAGTGGSAPIDGGASGGADDGGSDAGTCASDGDCKAPTRFCDTTHAICVQCLSDNHCPTGQTCGLSDHVCKFACTSSADCKDPRPYCDTRRSECVECLSDTNCSAGNKHVCESKTRTCVECAANNDCLCLLPGQVPCCTTTNVCTCGLLICL